MSEIYSSEVITKSPEETFAFGRIIGESCRGGECFMLHGTLGAGKTCLMQGAARGLGVNEAVEVVSPTFVLHCQYQGRLVFNHIDAYRLEGAGDHDSLGFDEMFDDEGAVTAVEWAEIVDDIIPDRKIDIHIELLSDKERKIILSCDKSQSESFSHVMEAAKNFSC
ncbi:MAG: tRNA (adenosine(37)-N6)-threonylcarbamoyltransferase complex ATPase subunit type 1 TsaE [Planctomycetota bacterium]|jgi:tRNA threonylcarbamoyladenosine biosynthesis protein TsaE